MKQRDEIFDIAIYRAGKHHGTKQMGSLSMFLYCLSGLSIILCGLFFLVMIMLGQEDTLRSNVVWLSQYGHELTWGVKEGENVKFINLWLFGSTAIFLTSIVGLVLTGLLALILFDDQPPSEPEKKQ